MKKTTKIILWFAALVLSWCVANSQTVVKQDSAGVYKVVKQKQKPPQMTGKVFQDEKGNKYPIYKTETGAYYVLRTSSKTGKQYKQYLKID